MPRYMYEDACLQDLVIPDRKYYLGDAGFPSCKQLLIPYHGPWYHLVEWGHASVMDIG